MFRLISIHQINNGPDNNPSNRPYRCTILADDASASPPVDGGEIDGMLPGQKILPGSVCITPALDIAIMGNDGKWGEWV